MFRYLLAGCLALVCAPCWAEPIAGTYSRLELSGENGTAGTFVIESPAFVNYLMANDLADVTIHGGQFGEVELFGQSLAFDGGTSIGDELPIFAWEGTEIDFHVADITPESIEAIERMNGTGEGRFIRVRMRLASGDLLNARLARPVDGARPSWNVLYAADSMTDAGLDGMIGIAELNAVRNTFGSDHYSGDLDLDGEVDIQDLNLVRNHFGSAYFPVLGNASAVPEPSSLSIVGLLASVGLWGWRKRHAR